MRSRPAQYSDDGAAINSFYTTAFLAATGLSGTKSFRLPHGLRAGRGLARAFRALRPATLRRISLGSWTLGSPASRDMEQFTNVLAERVSYQFGTNAAGSWFSLTKLVPWAKPDPSPSSAAQIDDRTVVVIAERNAANLFLREASGHAAEGSLFDFAAAPTDAQGQGSAGL